ncbi:MAG TPA: biopolymer transporter ExbD [Candidatus Angelobacter sp.]|nr:biopolymer transporter ExbD [Candidatus Angelobacter sp.]
MGISVGGRRGIVADPNVVPLIDILLVLLVIFMIIPVHSKGLDALIPQSSKAPETEPPPDGLVVVQVLEDNSLRINQRPVAWDALPGRLDEIFKMRASRIAFIRGDRVVEFSVVARVIDVMHGVGISSVGLLTPDLEQGL